MFIRLLHHPAVRPSNYYQFCPSCSPVKWKLKIDFSSGCETSMRSGIKHPVPAPYAKCWVSINRRLASGKSSVRVTGSSSQPDFFHLVTLLCTGWCNARLGFTVDCRPLKFQLTWGSGAPCRGLPTPAGRPIFHSASQGHTQSRKAALPQGGPLKA